MSDICEVWKYQPVKDGFLSISQKFYRAVILWCVGQKTTNFHQIFSLIAAFQKLYFRVYCCFHVLVLVDLDDIRWNEAATLTARNFNNSWLLCFHFSNVTNLCPNIWLIKNSKCQQFLFWRKNHQKNTNFSFPGALFRNTWPY